MKGFEMIYNSKHGTGKSIVKERGIQKTKTEKDENLVLHTNTYKMQTYINPNWTKQGG